MTIRVAHLRDQGIDFAVSEDLIREEKRFFVLERPD